MEVTVFFPSGVFKGAGSRSPNTWKIGNWFFNSAGITVKADDVLLMLLVYFFLNNRNYLLHFIDHTVDRLVARGDLLVDAFDLWLVFLIDPLTLSFPVGQLFLNRKQLLF